MEAGRTRRLGLPTFIFGCRFSKFDVHDSSFEPVKDKMAMKQKMMVPTILTGVRPAVSIMLRPAIGGTVKKFCRSKIQESINFDVIEEYRPIKRDWNQEGESIRKLYYR